MVESLVLHKVLIATAATPWVAILKNAIEHLMYFESVANYQHTLAQTSCLTILKLQTGML